MKTRQMAAAAAAALLLFATAASAAEGVVKKIDGAASKITLEHGPIESLQMDEPMTMVFRAADPAMLRSVKVGDRVTFEAGRVNGRITVTKITKTR